MLEDGNRTPHYVAEAKLSMGLCAVLRNTNAILDRWEPLGIFKQRNGLVSPVFYIDNSDGCEKEI